MANIFKGLLSSLRLNDDDDELEDEYDEYILEQEEKIRKKEKMNKHNLVNSSTNQDIKRPTQSSQNKSIFKDDYDVSSNSVSFNNRPKERPVKSTSNKVVPLRNTMQGMEVCIIRPTKFEDSQEISDVVISGRACVVNLEGFDVDLAQRVMDFISGSLYAVNGRLHQISSYIFIISPDNVDISGDYSEYVKQGSPILNKGF